MSLSFFGNAGESDLTSIEQQDDEWKRTQTLRFLRMSWLVFMAFQIGFLFFILWEWENSASGKYEPDMAQITFWVTVGMFVVVIPLGYFVRGQLYKKFWVGSAVSPHGYRAGNLILLAACEGVSLLGLQAVRLEGSVWPMIVPSVAAMAVQLINYPNGCAMVPAKPVFSDDR